MAIWVDSYRLPLSSSHTVCVSVLLCATQCVPIGYLYCLSSTEMECGSCQSSPPPPKRTTLAASNVCSAPLFFSRDVERSHPDCVSMIWLGTLSLAEIGKPGTGNICHRSRNACLCISAKIMLTFTGVGVICVDLHKVVGI